MRLVIALVGLLSVIQFSICPAADARIATTQDLILETLRSPCKFELTSASLDDLAVAIRQQFHVNVIVQSPAFEEMGMKDVRITYRAEGISLRSALLSMLEKFDATFAIRWESIVITTCDQAERYWRPGIYDVTDLLSADANDLNLEIKPGVYQKFPLADYNQLSTLIMTVVSPDTWSVATGPSADFVGMTVGDAHLLVTNQSESVHAEIEQLLTEMRRKVAARKNPNVEPPSTQQ